MDNFAPVLILTLCRYEHFKNCVESLSACKYSNKTDIFIALDYPLNKSHWEGYRKIDKYLVKSKNNFRSVNIIRRMENYGVLKNFQEATKVIFEKYDRYIVSEDDNIFSPNFLEYINKGLDKYKDSKYVFAINGYNYPVSMPSDYEKNTYLWKGLAGWGYGIWRDRWVNADIDLMSDKCFAIVSEYLSKKRNIIELNKYAGHYFPSLLKMVNSKSIRGDTLVNMYIIKNNLVCLFPVESKVRNMGHDGSGIHCGLIKNGIYSKQVIDSNNYFEFDNEIECENRQIYKILKSHFKRTLKGNIKIFLMYLRFLIKKG